MDKKGHSSVDQTIPNTTIVTVTCIGAIRLGRALTLYTSSQWPDSSNNGTRAQEDWRGTVWGAWGGGLDHMSRVTWLESHAAEILGWLASGSADTIRNKQDTELGSAPEALKSQGFEKSFSPSPLPANPVTSPASL